VRDHELTLTHTVIFGPGAYIFTDYQKLGIPLEVFLNIVQLLCLAYINVWYVTTAIAVVFLGLCVWVDQVIVNRRSIRELVPSCGCCCSRRGKAKNNTSLLQVRKRSDESPDKSESDPELSVPGNSAEGSATNSGASMMQLV
jgi:hypothetical protein